MQLFAGLGNPGAKYARNRHNIGFMALDALAEREGGTPW
ncbi:MAG: aminoacyl-tRNA hydrolase, partial [Pseudomonadota bacterium]